MNKELTAMQMLFNDMGWKIEEAPPLKKYLQKEQEQIEKAFDAGVTDVFEDAFDKENVIGSGEQYYQSKYGDENEN